MAANAKTAHGAGQAGSAGVHVSLAELAALELRARGFSLMPSQPVHSLLTGRRA